MTKRGVHEKAGSDDLGTLSCAPEAGLPREIAHSYWAGKHAETVKGLPHLMEYNQYHFSSTDHGYWPATEGVGTVVPSPRPIDGLTEVRFPSMAAAFRVPLHMREVFLDEQNVFEHCLGHVTGPAGGRWWTSGHDDTVGHRTVLLLRRRRGVCGPSFRAFVHTRLGRALHAAGARDLRTYTFLPMAAVTHATFGVCHENPSHRRHHGAVVFGIGTREDVDGVIASPEVAAVVKDQHLTCTAIHAFTVDRTVPVIRMNGGESRVAHRHASTPHSA
jgi:hypothetical protein